MQLPALERARLSIRSAEEHGATLAALEPCRRRAAGKIVGVSVLGPPTPVRFAAALPTPGAEARPKSWVRAKVLSGPKPAAARALFPGEGGARTRVVRESRASHPVTALGEILGAIRASPLFLAANLRVVRMAFAVLRGKGYAPGWVAKYPPHVLTPSSRSRTSSGTSLNIFGRVRRQEGGQAQARGVQPRP